jgi:membrane dipeptidase
VSLPALREGNIGLVVATQLARYVAEGRPADSDPYFNSPEIAWSITQAQLAYYRVMEDLGEMVQVTNSEQLEKHLKLWLDNDGVGSSGKPVGYILSLEGADSLINLSYLQKAYANGLRALGPSHYGVGRYAAGTGGEGGLTGIGRELLKEMDSLHMILDVTHLTDKGFQEAMELYKGPVWASHHNCRAVVKGDRQLSDDQIRVLIDRDAVIGGAFDNWMLTDNWKRGIDDPLRRKIGLDRIVAHYDHICQLAGNSLHCAIGSDLDGMFGKEQCPYDLETIADLQKLGDILEGRGYGSEDIENIFCNNWIRFLKKNLG